MKYFHTIIICLLPIILFAQDWQQTFGPQETTIQIINKINNHLYIGTSFGSYRSSDGGEIWEKILIDQEQINGFAQCKERLFAAGKDGVFISEDKGITWTKSSEIPSVNTLKISVREPEVFILVEKFGLYYSADCGNTWETITKIFETPEGQVHIDHFGINNSALLVADASGGIHLSTDLGKKWEKIKWQENKIAIVTCISGWEKDFLIGTERNGIFRLDLKERQFIIFSRGIYRGLKINCVKTVNKSNLYASAGYSAYKFNPAIGEWKLLSINTNSQIINCFEIFDDELFLSIQENGLFKLNVDGSSYERIFKGIQPGSQVIKIVPDEEIIWAGTRFSGIYKSADFGKTWQWAGVKDNISSLFANTTYVIAGTESGKIYFSKNDGINWGNSELPNKSKSEVMTSVLAVAYSEEVMYAGNWNGFFRSIDGGYTWNAIRINGAQTGRTTAILASGNFLLVATSRGLFRSFDGGVSWNYISEGLDKEKFVLSIIQTGKKIILTTEDQIYISANYGQYWEKLSVSGLPPDFQISSVTVTGEHLLASVYNHGDKGIILPKGVYHFNGTDWLSLSYGIEGKDIYCIASDADRIYAGIEWEGIFIMDRLDNMVMAKETENK
jgi:photosystem II stability/assembly factor-like uncharacterized protein